MLIRGIQVGEGGVVRDMASVPCRAVPSGVSSRMVFVLLTSFAILPGGDSFLPGHLSAPSAQFVMQHRLGVCRGGGGCQRVPIPLTSRRPRPFPGLFSLRGGGAAAEESVRDGEKNEKKEEKRLVPPGAVYGMGFGAITASRIAHVRPHPGGNPGAYGWFLWSAPIQMPPESGRICGRLT